MLGSSGVSLGAGARNSTLITSAIGLGQILNWGSVFYLIAIIARPVEQETGWSFTAIIAGHALGLLVAGLVSPRVGRLIERLGGRRVLAGASLLMACGQVALSLSNSLAGWYGAWALLGLAMACGLYDAAFSTLSQIFGRDARGAITNVTLFGGLASTICWPLTAYMIAQIGWRDACLVFALIHLCLALPMHLCLVPQTLLKLPLQPEEAIEEGDEPQMLSPVYFLLSIILMVAASVGAIVSVHLIALLQARGLDLAVAVGMGALFGPAQVGARILERLFGGKLHPVWTLVISVVLTCLGLVLLGLHAGVALIAVALLLYGAGNGINSIAKGTVPLALFGPRFYARIMGRLALPSLIAQALAPALVALLMEARGSESALHVLVFLTLANCAAVLWLAHMTRAERAVD